MVKMVQLYKTTLIKYHNDTWGGNGCSVLKELYFVMNLIIVPLATKSAGSIFEPRKSVASTMMPPSTKIGIVLIP